MSFLIFPAKVQERVLTSPAWVIYPGWTWVRLGVGFVLLDSHDLSRIVMKEGSDRKMESSKEEVGRR